MGAGTARSATPRHAREETRAGIRPIRSRRMGCGVMATLFCFGLGYSASHYIAAFGGRFDRITGTVTTREKAAAIAAAGIGGHKAEAFVFDGADASPQITAALM